MEKVVSTLLVSILAISTFAFLSVEGNAETATSAYLTDFLQLTTNPMRDRQPIWSPDGTEMAYFAFDSGGWYRHVWTMNPDGTGKTQRTFGDVVDETGDYSPDGTKISFIRYRGASMFDIKILHLADNTVEHFLTKSGESLHMPRWSNDGTKILFNLHKDSDTVHEIHMINTDGTNEVTLVTLSYHGLHACWSPDDTQVIFVLDDGLWLVDTTPPYAQTPLFSTSHPATHAAYSPDGEYILYLQAPSLGDYQDLCLINANGDFIVQLTTDTSMSYPFDWSPDGQYVVFGSNRGGNEDIWRARLVIGESPAVACWKFDEGAGTIAGDSSGNGNTGTLVGAPEWTTGIREGALSFDGVDDFVQVPHSASLGITGNAISVGLWMKPTITLDGESHPVNFVGKGMSYVMQLEHDYDTGELLYNGELTFAVSIEQYANWATVRTTTNVWLADNWYYIVGTYDGSTMKIYVNGVLENSQSQSGVLYSLDENPLGIGSHYLGDNPWEPWNEHFTGIIDEVKVYDHAKTADEIRGDCVESEPRGMFIRLGQLLGITQNQSYVDDVTARDFIDEFVGKVQSSNFNAVFVGFKDDGACYDDSRPDEEYYASGNLMYNSASHPNLIYGPVQYLLDAPFSFDPMGYLVNQLKAVGIGVHVWFPVFQDRLAIVDPDLQLAALPVGTAIPNFTDPRVLEVRNYNWGLISEIMQTYDVDGINLDHIRCDAKTDPLTKLDCLQDIVDFVSEVRTLIEPLVLSADVFPDDVWSAIRDYG